MGNNGLISSDEIGYAAKLTQRAADSLHHLSNDELLWNIDLSRSALADLTAALFYLLSPDRDTIRDPESYISVLRGDSDQITVSLVSEGSHDLLGGLVLNDELLVAIVQRDIPHDSSPSVDTSAPCAGCGCKQPQSTEGEPQPGANQ